MGGLLSPTKWAGLGLSFLYGTAKREMALRRGFALNRGEGVGCRGWITTGGSVREVLALVKAVGAEPIGVAYWWTGVGRADFNGLPLRSLVRMESRFHPESLSAVRLRTSPGETRKQGNKGLNGPFTTGR